LWHGNEDCQGGIRPSFGNYEQCTPTRGHVEKKMTRIVRQQGGTTCFGRGNRSRSRNVKSRGRKMFALHASRPRPRQRRLLDGKDSAMQRTAILESLTCCLERYKIPRFNNIRGNSRVLAISSRFCRRTELGKSCRIH